MPTELHEKTGETTSTELEQMHRINAVTCAAGMSYCCAEHGAFVTVGLEVPFPGLPNMLAVSDLTPDNARRVATSLMHLAEFVERAKETAGEDQALLRTMLGTYSAYCGGSGTVPIDEILKD